MQAHALDNEIKARKMFDQNMIISLTERERIVCVLAVTYQARLADTHQARLKYLVSFLAILSELSVFVSIDRVMAEYI